MSFVVVLFSVVHKWYSILFIIAELQFTVIIYGYLIPREKLQKFSRDKTICTKYNSTFSIFQNSNMKEKHKYGLVYKFGHDSWSSQGISIFFKSGKFFEHCTTCTTLGIHIVYIRENYHIYTLNHFCPKRRK